MEPPRAGSGETPVELLEGGLVGKGEDAWDMDSGRRKAGDEVVELAPR